MARAEGGSTERVLRKLPPLYRAFLLAATLLARHSSSTTLATDAGAIVAAKKITDENGSFNDAATSARFAGPYASDGGGIVAEASSPKRPSPSKNGPLELDSASHFLLIEALIGAHSPSGSDGGANFTVTTFAKVVEELSARAKMTTTNRVFFADIFRLEPCLPKQPLSSISPLASETKNLTNCLKNRCSIITTILATTNTTTTTVTEKDENNDDDLEPGKKMTEFENVATRVLVAAIEGKCGKGDNDDDANDEDILHGQPHGKIPWQHSLGYGSAFTAIIILGSQFGGLLYPFRHSLIYKICLTYLIGLAVGTLSGGGILHLMPHTFGLEEAEEGNEFIFRASTILGGVYLFYVVERLLRDVNHWRKERRRLRKETQRMQRRWELKRAQSKSGVDGTTSTSVDATINDTDATPFAVAFEPQVTVIAPTTNGGASSDKAIVNGVSLNESVAALNHDEAINAATTPSLLTPTCDPGFPGDGSHDLLILRKSLEMVETGRSDDGDGQKRSRRPSETHAQNALMEEESHRVRLPSHTHAEVNDTRHEAGEIAPIAWIVIMAKVYSDSAFSSFIDGLSMGAAFTESTLTGVKIAIAIICEEFPHELGDIAILLNSGMNFKQALVFNCLAASPTFFGLCVGIAVGENTNANPWIFAIAAGMFLYIALVDMIPELNTLVEDLVRSGINHIAAYVIQHAGILSGFLLMLIMAIYGNDIDI